MTDIGKLTLEALKVEIKALGLDVKDEVLNELLPSINNDMLNYLSLRNRGKVSEAYMLLDLMRKEARLVADRIVMRGVSATNRTIDRYLKIAIDIVSRQASVFLGGWLG